jgi:phenylacetate-CoA ligase
VLDEGVLVEIVRPGTGDPVPDGEVGELVVTSLNPVYPLIRFGTGDLSAILPGTCPTGRTNTRIKGWMGRADQTTKIRGMFVHPGQVRRSPSVSRRWCKARLVVTRRDGQRHDDAAGRDRLQRGPTAWSRRSAAIREVTKLRGDVELVLARQPAQRRQGDRGRAQLPVTAGGARARSGQGSREQALLVISSMRWRAAGTTRLSLSSTSSS